MKDNTLKEARRLYGLGFAIIWLHPKSKRPIGTGWTTGPRTSWAELESSYRPGNNVGVRLGEPSQIGKHYLAALDVDVKSTDPVDRNLAWGRAAEILQGADCPVVLSGRGNGSCHFYFLTQEPFKTWDPAESEKEVLVHMPSKAPSKRELEELSGKEIKKGMRFAPAWQLSFYSSGRQVVLPPSIHPDSGKPYAWKEPLSAAWDLPIVDVAGGPDAPARKSALKGKRPVERGEETKFDFKAVNVEIAWLPLDEKIREGILTGKGIKDRSAFLIPAAHALLSAGCDETEMLSVLTDRGTYLGKCAYEHAKTDNQARAAYWVWKYTTRTIVKERDPKEAFKGIEIVTEVPLSEDAVKIQTEEIKAELSESAAARGYYKKGKRDALVPDYEALLKAFENEHPYRAIADMKGIFLFNGTHYVDRTPMELKNYAEKKMNPKPEERIRAEFQAKLFANHVTRRTFFTESVEGKVNFKNGVLDLNRGPGKLLPHSDEYGFRGVLPFDFDLGARCPVFYKWLKSIMLNDKELVAILQEYMGYIVRGGDYKYHKALWLEGVGRNGKSTFVDMLKALIGPGNFSVLSIKSLVADKFAGASLDGKIANFSEETSKHELTDSGTFKNLTGDGDVYAQKKYGDPYFFRNKAKLIMTYNQIPDLTDLTPGMLARPMVIPFRKIIGEEEQDRGIKEKLFKELPGIFNFAMRGWERLEAQGGFTESEKSKAALRKIKEESCNVYQWVSDRIELTGQPYGAGEAFPAHRLYDIYKQNERYAYKCTEFYKRLKAHPKMKNQYKRIGDGIMYFGIKVN